MFPPNTREDKCFDQIDERKLTLFTVCYFDDRLEELRLIPYGVALSKEPRTERRNRNAQIPGRLDNAVSGHLSQVSLGENVARSGGSHWVPYITAKMLKVSYR